MILIERRTKGKRFFWICFSTAIALGLMWSLVNCGGGGGGGGAVDPCAGRPVPCLWENWFPNYYVYQDQYGFPVVLLSDGVDMGAGAIAFYGGADFDPVVLLGSIVDCYNSSFYYAEVDFSEPHDFTPDYATYDVEGFLSICGAGINLYDLTLGGHIYGNISASFVGMETFEADPLVKSDSPQALVSDLMEILREASDRAN